MVTKAEAGDACRTEVISEGDQRGVGSAEGQVLVAVDEIADALPVGCGEGLTVRVPSMIASWNVVWACGPSSRVSR